jgi:hypothetical protein
MSRARILKPSFFKDSDLFDAEKRCELPLRVAYAGMWCAADREGRFAWKPRELKPDVLPYDDVDFAAVLDALETNGFIERYIINGREYGYIPNFPTHQTVHPREQASKIPAPPDVRTKARTTTDQGAYNLETPIDDNAKSLSSVVLEKSTDLGALGYGPRLRSVEAEVETHTEAEVETESETEAAVAEVFPAYAEFCTNNRQVVDNWLRTIPTAPLARGNFVAETNKALQSGLTHESGVDVMRDWTTARPNNPSLGLWREFLRKAMQWQGRQKKRHASAAATEGKSPALDAFKQVRSDVSKVGGHKFYTKAMYDAWPEEVREGIKSAGGISVISGADGNQLEITRSRFVEGYNSAAVGAPA